MTSCVTPIYNAECKGIPPAIHSLSSAISYEWEGGSIIDDTNITARCDLCGEPITLDDKYYALPDGTTLCADDDCLEQWLKSYVCHGSYY